MNNIILLWRFWYVNGAQMYWSKQKDNSWRNKWANRILFSTLRYLVEEVVTEFELDCNFWPKSIISSVAICSNNFRRMRYLFIFERGYVKEEKIFQRILHFEPSLQVFINHLISKYILSSEVKQISFSKIIFWKYNFVKWR